MALSTQPRKIWIEVVALYAAVIAAILIFKLFSFVPFIKDNLWGVAGLLFLFVPLEFLHRKGEDLANFGIGLARLGRPTLLGDLWALMKSRKKEDWAPLVQGAKWAGLFILLSFPIYIPGYKLWFSRTEFHLDLPADFWKEAVGFLFLVALPEEVFYRGYMQKRLDAVFTRRVRILGADVGWSVVVTAAFFAVGHLVEPRLDKLGTFFPGLVFGWLRAKTGTVGGAVIFHAACDIWAEVLRFGYFGVPGQ